MKSDWTQTLIHSDPSGRPQKSKFVDRHVFGLCSCCRLIWSLPPFLISAHLGHFLRVSISGLLDSRILLQGLQGAPGGLANFDFEDLEFRPRSACFARFVFKQLISGNRNIFIFFKSWRENLKCWPRWMCFFSGWPTPAAHGWMVQGYGEDRHWFREGDRPRKPLDDNFRSSGGRRRRIQVRSQLSTSEHLTKTLNGTLELLMFSRQLIDLTALMLQVQGRDRPWGTQGVQGSTLPERRRLAMGPDLGLCSGGSSHYWRLCPMHHLRQEKGKAQRELPSQRHRRRYVRN